MDLIQALFWGILPAGLLMWIGNLIRARANDEKAGLRWLWFLLGGLGSLIVALIVSRLISDYVFNLAAMVLLPITFGFTAAMILHLFLDRGVWLQDGMKAIPLFLLIITLLAWFTISNDWRALLPIAFVGILTVLVWLAWDRAKRWHLFLYAFEVFLLGLNIWVVDTNRIAEIIPSWLGYLISIGMYAFIPGMAIVMAALLIRTLLSNDQFLNWHMIISTLLMAAVLFLMIGYQGMLTSMWDVATDGLGWIILWLITSILGIGSAMLLAWSIPRRQIWVAVVFTLVIPLVMWQARNLGTYDKDHTWGTTPIITTETRADKIDHAIQQYYEKNNRYPQTLSDLSPRYILYIPNPFIIPGQDWCYEGDHSYYRFGYIYRQTFSSPVSVRIHSSAGEPPDTNWECQREADRYPTHPGF